VWRWPGYVRQTSRNRLLYVEVFHQLHLRKLYVRARGCCEAADAFVEKLDQVFFNVCWRICFEWRDKDVYNVEIVDYHYVFKGHMRGRTFCACISAYLCLVKRCRPELPHDSHGAYE